MAGDSLGDHAEVLHSRQQAARTGGVLPNEHYINVMAQTVTRAVQIDSFEKIRKIFHMFHGVLIPRSTLNHMAAELDPLYREIRRDLNRLAGQGTPRSTEGVVRVGLCGEGRTARRPV